MPDHNSKNNDYAVIIGIERYPGLNDLQGPCNDAVAFKNWLLREDGGNLLAENVKTLMTTDYPPPISINDAHPVRSDLEQLFRPLVTKAAKKEHIAERLFIFVAGHGLADSNDADSAALYTADADNYNPFHLAVLDYGNYFKRTYAFDEIIMVLDTCRVINLMHAINKAPVPNVKPHSNAGKVKIFIGFGTGYGQESREKMIDGKVRGIFTATLLDALDNAEPNRNDRVTGSSIKKYIHNAIYSIAGDTIISPPEIIADNYKDVVFAVRENSKKYVINFLVRPEMLNHELVILFGGRKEQERVTICDQSVSVELHQGLYKVNIEGTNISKTIEVTNNVTINL